MTTSSVQKDIMAQNFYFEVLLYEHLLKMRRNLQLIVGLLTFITKSSYYLQTLIQIQ